MKSNQFISLLTGFAFIILLHQNTQANPIGYLYLYNNNDTIIRQSNAQERIIIQDGMFTGIGYQRKDTGTFRSKPAKRDNWDDVKSGLKRFVITDNKISPAGKQTEIEKIKTARKQKEKSIKPKDANDTAGRFILKDGKFIGVGKKNKQ
ncbi:MAG: hypothetical protein ACOYVG_01125 [Bacteroidota bacterium]